MKLRYLITTSSRPLRGPREIFNKYAVYEGEQRMRVRGGYLINDRYYESKAQREAMERLRGALGERVLVRAVADPSNPHYVVFEALRRVRDEIEI